MLLEQSTSSDGCWAGGVPELTGKSAWSAGGVRLSSTFVSIAGVAVTFEGASVNTSAGSAACLRCGDVGGLAP